MTKANFVKSAQKAIYEQGSVVSYESKKGKNIGKTLSKIDRTVPRDKDDKILIQKGESYWWWSFVNGPKHISKTRPKNSHLTQSNYLSQLYDIQDVLDNIEASQAEDLASIVDSIKDDLENLKDETQGSLDNMPESLQSSPTAELLQERIDALDSAISELESIDLEYEEPTLEDWASEEDVEEANDEDDIDFIEWKNGKLQEWLDEKKDELQSVSLE